MPFNSVSSRLKFAVPALTLAMLCAVSSASADTHSDQSQSSSMEQTRTVNLKKGQVLQLYTEDRKINAGSEREALLATTTPLAVQHGLKQEIEFAVRATAAGTFKPNAVSLHSAPSADALNQLSASPDWKSIQPLRAAAYNDMKTYSQVLENDVSINFDPTKLYTVGIFWMNPENPDDFNVYFNGLKPTVEEIGGRFIHQMNNPHFSTVSSGQQGPGRLIFIEWESPESLGKLSKTTTYQELQKYRISGTTDFEFHILQPQMN